MLQIIMLVVLLLVCARLAFGKAETPSVMGWLLVIVGIAVFAIRLQHDGPYALPRDGNMRAGVLALVLGVCLSMEWHSRGGPVKFLVRVGLFASPVVLFFALYSTLAEAEEVVVLRATQPSGEAHDIRLWIVDIDGAAWVTMPGSKANANGLLETRAELLRDGELRCVDVTRFTDPETVNNAHRSRHEKYFVQRLATSIGLFGETAQPDVVALKLRPCANR